MPWKHVHTLKDKRPGHIGNLTDDLRVHQVAQADETGGSARGNGDIVENGPYLQFRPADIENQGDDQTECSAVRGQSFITRELPTTIGHEMYGQEHLHEVLAGSEEIVGLIEQTVS